MVERAEPWLLTPHWRYSPWLAITALRSFRCARGHKANTEAAAKEKAPGSRGLPGAKKPDTLSGLPGVEGVGRGPGDSVQRFGLSRFMAGQRGLSLHSADRIFEVLELRIVSKPAEKPRGRARKEK
jgi:hypothetical protein